MYFGYRDEILVEVLDGSSRYLLFSLPAGNGRDDTVALTTDVLNALVRYLIHRRLLWRLGDKVAIVDGVPQTFDRNASGLSAYLGRRFFFARTDNAPTEPPVLPNSADLPGPRARFLEVCRTSGWSFQQLPVTSVLTNAIATCGVELPEYIGRLRHPLLGDTPEGTFPAAAPPSVPDYPRLRALLSSLPTSDLGRLRAAAYLCYHLHAASLDRASPLLLVDSWIPSAGKTETSGAIKILIDAENATFDAPRSGDTDAIVSHFEADHRMIVLDNLEAGRAWQNTWISNLLTSRTAGARAKYSAKSATYRGKMVALNLIYGRAALADDLATRAWRVELRTRKTHFFDLRLDGDAATVQPTTYAAAYRDELLAEAYHATARAAPWTLGNPDGGRCFDALAIGVPAAAEILGWSHEQAAQILSENAGDFRAFGRQFVAAVVDSTGTDSNITARPLSTKVMASHVGLRGGGVVYTDEGFRSEK